MGNDIVVAAISFVGTLLGSLFGILAAQKLTLHRLTQLEKKTERHDSDIRSVEIRTTKLEGRVTQAEHDIQDLKLPPCR